MVYAFWNPAANNSRGEYEIDTRTELQLVPVSEHLQQTWLVAYRQGTIYCNVPRAPTCFRENA